MIFLISWFQLWPTLVRPARLCKKLLMKWKTAMNSLPKSEFEISLGSMLRLRSLMRNLSINKYLYLSSSWLWMSLLTSWWLPARKWKMPLSVSDKRRVQLVFTWYLQPNVHRLMLSLVWLRQMCRLVWLLQFLRVRTHVRSWMKTVLRNCLDEEICSLSQSMKIILFVSKVPLYQMTMLSVLWTSSRRKQMLITMKALTQEKCLRQKGILALAMMSEIRSLKKRKLLSSKHKKQVHPWFNAVFQSVLTEQLDWWKN